MPLSRWQKVSFLQTLRPTSENFYYFVNFKNSPRGWPNHCDVYVNAFQSSVDPSGNWLNAATKDVI
jgi:hypothetical protein